jgi:threonine dehydratase
MISSLQIEQAAQRISAYIRHTPVMTLAVNEWDSSALISLKLEQVQFSGSFKARGAFNRLLSQSVPSAGVIAASGGNHGAAVAYAAQRLGYRAEIFVPEITSPTKIELLHSYGAEVTIAGVTYADALYASELRARETSALVVHAYDQPEVIAGQGTLAHELSQQLPDLDTIIVAVGGGGLISGIASWYQGRTRIIGVESFGTSSLSSALQAGKPVDVEVSGIAADALGARRIGTLAFPITQAFVERSVLVSDDAIHEAQLFLWRSLRLVVEPAAAATVAAIRTGAYRPAPGERVALIICGANAALDRFTQPR